MSASPGAATAWCQPPRVSAAGRDSIRKLQYTTATDTMCYASENTLAAWLWLVVRAGQLRASEVEAALRDRVEWHRLLELVERGGRRLTDALGATAARVVPQAVAAMDWGWWLGLYVPLDGRDPPQIRLVAHSELDVRIDFLALPSELASALCETFRLLQSLLPMDLGYEQFCRMPMADDRLGDYEALRDRGLLDKPDEALAYLQESGIADEWEAFGEDITTMLASAPDWLDRARYWPGTRSSGSVRERAEALHRLTERWRMSDHPWRDSAWLPFIEGAVAYVQARGDLPEWFCQHDAVLPIDDMEMDLAIACCVLSSNAVEEELLHDYREMVAQTGEDVVVTLSLDASNRDSVWPLLKDVAVATGLIAWARVLADGG